MNNSDFKKCKTCGTETTVKWFSGPLCRQCYRKQPHIKEEEKKSRLKKIEHYRKVAKLYSSTHKKKKKERDAQYYQEHKEYKKAIKKTYKQKNKKRINEYSRKYQNVRRQDDVDFRIRCALRSRLSHALKLDSKSGSAVKDLGCTIPELKNYIESKWQTNMSWDNYSLLGWHIDHISPLASFDLTNKEEFLKACHYTNLQPLWAHDNLSKGKK